MNSNNRMKKVRLSDMKQKYSGDIDLKAELKK